MNKKAAAARRRTPEAKEKELGHRDRMYSHDGTGSWKNQPQAKKGFFRRRFGLCTIEGEEVHRAKTTASSRSAAEEG